MKKMDKRGLGPASLISDGLMITDESVFCVASSKNDTKNRAHPENIIFPNNYGTELV
jgi:hypothetical protein